MTGSDDDQPHASSQGISPLTGRAQPSSAEVEAAREATLRRSASARHALLHDALTESDVAAMFGARPAQRPRERVDAGLLIAVMDDGALRFPRWQFDDRGPDGVIDGLPAVIRALPPMTDFGRVVWFLAPKPQLSGRSPVQALKDGDTRAVLAEAQAAHAS